MPHYYMLMKHYEFQFLYINQVFILNYLILIGDPILSLICASLINQYHHLI